MNIKAYAKINLTLEITGKILAGGYHELRTVMHKIPICDELEVGIFESPSSAVHFECSVQLCEKQQNLAYKAALAYIDAFRQKTNRALGAKISLEKHIPSGAGLGGGSADAAAVLRALNMLCGDEISEDELMKLAESLGSDVPFCLYPEKCAFCTGRGEIITPSESLPDCFALVAKPAESISTKGIYAEYDRTVMYSSEHGEKKNSFSAVSFLEEGTLLQNPHVFVNDFEKICIPKCKDIELIKTVMKRHGALVSMMTGSGSAVFGLFCDRDGAFAAYDELKRENAGFAQVCEIKK